MSSRLRVSLPAVSAVVFGACESADRLTRALDEVTDGPPAVAPILVAAPSLSDATGGMPFGFYHMPNDLYGETYTGALRSMSPAFLLTDLEAARTAGANVIVSFVGPDKFYKNADGTFSLEKWKARLEPFRSLDFSSYVDDGTIVGHYLIDEPQDVSNWNGTQVSRATLDEMARYSKQIWPTMATIVRTWTWYLKGYDYQYLDAAWAQYADRFGAVTPWLDANVRDAKVARVALIMGVNMIAGGNAATGLPGYYLNYYALNAAQFESVGGAMLDDPYPCAFVSWKYQADYLARSDIQAVLAALATKAGARPFKNCRGEAAQATPPPPPLPPRINQPPTAAFAAPSCLAGVPCQFNDASGDTDGYIATRSWAFGDGATSSQANPSKTYAGAGPYSVTLTVTDNEGASGSVSQNVTVRPTNLAPTAAFTPPNCTAGSPCQFTDASGDTDGSIATRSWAFGDGATSSQANPSNTYAGAGSYSVALTVTDNEGASGSVSQNVTVRPANLVPTAAFTPPTCTAGSPCQFNDASSDTDGSIATRSWAFGDGAISSQANPSNTYAGAGSYSVTLTVTDNEGASGSVSQNVTVRPANLAPTAAFTPPTCTAGSPCQFNDASSDTDGSIATRSWAFGDGTTSTQANPSHTYAGAGSYSVALTVTDNEGAKGSVSRSLTVASPPVPKPSPIALSVKGWVSAGKQYMALTWSGATGTTVDVYRSASFLTNTLNDGKYTNSRIFLKPITYTYKVCNKGTAICSNSASVTFK